MLFDVIFHIYRRKQAARLITELSHFPTFDKLLKVGDKRARLHKMMQATVELRSKVPDILAQVTLDLLDLYAINDTHYYVGILSVYGEVDDQTFISKSQQHLTLQHMQGFGAWIQPWRFPW